MSPVVEHPPACPGHPSRRLNLRRRLAPLLLGLLVMAGLSTAPASADPVTPRITIVIDDLGYNLPRDRRLLAMPRPLVLAVLPESPHATEYAREARQAGHSVLLHMPMAPADGPYAWHPGMPVDKLRTRLDQALARVPQAIGLNNHMGSRMTVERPAMAWLMHELQQRHLLFLDSRTIAASVAAPEARRIGLASASRDIFLDDKIDARLIAEQYQRGLAMARRKGSAIMIGHPHAATLDLLQRELPRLAEQGIELIDLPQMIALRGNRAP